MADPNAKTMRTLVGKGQAMPPKPGSGGNGRFPIRNRSDLAKAIQAVGRVRPNTDAARASVRRYIVKRAASLGASDAIPANWNSDGSLKTSS